MTAVNKLAVATVVSMLKVALGQLRKILMTAKHEKVEAATQHLEHCIAECEDACLEKK